VRRLLGAHHIDEFYPLSNVLAVLRSIDQPREQKVMCPALSEVAIVVKKLPVFHSYIYTSYSDWVFGAIQAVMKMRFQELDECLYAFREKNQGHDIFSLELTLDDVNAMEVNAAREMLQSGGSELFGECGSCFASNPRDKGEFSVEEGPLSFLTIGLLFGIARLTFISPKFSLYSHCFVVAGRCRTRAYAFILVDRLVTHTVYMPWARKKRCTTPLVNGQARALPRTESPPLECGYALKVAYPTASAGSQTAKHPTIRPFDAPMRPLSQ
jgi:hypothetical protein